MMKISEGSKAGWLAARAARKIRRMVQVTRAVIYPQALGKWWKRRRSNNWFFGALFDLTSPYYVTDGCRFAIPKDLTTRGFRTRFFFDAYEPEERELTQSFVLPNDRILELGGCIGVVSCVINRCLADPRQHVVVEANPALIPWLYRNRELNQCGFVILHGAVDDAPSVNFYLHEMIVGGSADRQTNKHITVATQSLAQLEKNYGPFTGLVVDIEGGELRLLEQAHDWLLQLRFVLIEYHHFALGEAGVARCRELLLHAGFEPRRTINVVEMWTRKQSSP